MTQNEIDTIISKYDLEARRQKSHNGGVYYELYFKCNSADSHLGSYDFSHGSALIATELQCYTSNDRLIVLFFDSKEFFIAQELDKALERLTALIKAFDLVNKQFETTMKKLSISQDFKEGL